MAPADLITTANTASYTLTWSQPSPPDEPDAGVMARTGPNPGTPPGAEGLYMIGEDNGCHGAPRLMVLREHAVPA